MKKISFYLKKYWYLYLLALFCLFIYEFLDMVSPKVTQSIIDDVITRGQTNLLLILILMLVVVGIGRVAAGYVREFTFDKTSFKVASDIRKHLFGHVQSLSVDYFDKMNTGEIMSRVKDDVDKLQGAFGFIGMMFLQVVIHTVMILWCMWQISPFLTIFPLIALPLCATIAIVMEKKLNKVYEEISDEDADMNTVAEENLTGVRVVKAFAREKFEIGKFLKHNKRYYDLNMKQSKVWIKYNPIMQMMTKLLIVTALFLGGLKVINGEMTLGALGAFLEYCANAVWPMEMLGWLSNELASAFASKKKLDKIYAETAKIKDPEELSAKVIEMLTGKNEELHNEAVKAGNISIEKTTKEESILREKNKNEEGIGIEKNTKDEDIRKEKNINEKGTSIEKDEEGISREKNTIAGNISKEARDTSSQNDLYGGLDFKSLSFKDVNFSIEGKKILDNVSFTLSKGKTLGIMGATGSGKTSIINMLLRFYDPESGRVLLNGVDIRELPLSVVRKNSSVVMQDVFLFSDTIDENIRLGNKDNISDDDISEALKKACAKSFVDKLEEGTETVIGERGVGLSGGQKQRISMARAFAKHAPVLVLDDSTSALDMETEHEVQENLSELKDATKIIIAHRISAVRHADEIIVLEEGKISERGSHEQLLEKKGYYYKTYMAQYGEVLKQLEKVN